MAPTRRAVLGGVALTVGLAGCTGTSGDQQTNPSTASPTETATDTPTPTDGGMGESTPEPDATVTVGPGGSLVFDPDRLELDVGATVQFVWDTSGHTVTVDSQPEGANWAGTGQSTEEAGFTLTHTFDVAGRYDYYCVPHRSAGMTGTLLVGDAGGTATGTATPSGTATPTSTGDGGGGDGYY